MISYGTERFIRPEVLSRIANLELLARGVVEGFVSGLHRSPYKGFSVEFAEYRPYTPGDDAMHVDWKLYGRTDRLYVKEFEEETNTSLHLLVDVSRSMSYGSADVSKLQYAFYLAASLAYFIIRQRDAVGLTLFDRDIVRRIPPRSTSSHLHRLLTELEQAEAGAATDLAKPLHLLADGIKRRGFVVLISDLLGDPEALADGLKHFRFNGHEVIVFHLIDPQEAAFQFEDLIEFEDLETGEKLLLDAETARAIYLENLDRFRERVERECGVLGIDYEAVTTDQPLDFALFEYLAARRKRLS